MQWILDNVDGARGPTPSAATRCSAPSTPGCCGTSPAAPHGGVHVTDVTNASRTMLMDLRDARLGRRTAGVLRAFRAPMLPAIRPSSSAEPYGVTHAGGPLAASPGRRHPRRPAGRAWSARSASSPARPRTPTAPATSCCSTPARRSCRRENGLLTTVCYQFGDAPARLRPGGLDRGHRRRGAVAARQPRASSAAPPRVEALAAHGRGQRRRLLRAGVLRAVRAVLALRRPRRDRRADAASSPRRHIARAALEATATRRREVVDAMDADSGRAARRCSRSTAGWSLNELLHAVPGRRARRAGGPAEGRRDHRARRGLRRRAGGRASGAAWTTCAPTGGSNASGGR